MMPSELVNNSMFNQEKNTALSEEPVLKQVEEQVILSHDGMSVAKSLVNKIVEKLKRLKTTTHNVKGDTTHVVTGNILDPLHLYFLVQKCNDPTYKLMHFTQEYLKKEKFLDIENNIPPEIRSIILSATTVEGIGFTIDFVDPTKPRETPVNIQPSWRN